MEIEVISKSDGKVTQNSRNELQPACLLELSAGLNPRSQGTVGGGPGDPYPGIGESVHVLDGEFVGEQDAEHGQGGNRALALAPLQRCTRASELLERVRQTNGEFA